MTNNTSSIKYYDTVATMRSDSTLSFGNFVKTHGYHDITDGGGNLYKITNENVFASIKLDNGLYAAPKVSGQRVNVRAFGAEGTGYGKPRVNDTEAFNLAFNYAASNGLSVYIPSGKYYITPIQINDIDSMVVEGDGQYLSQIGAHDDASNSNSPLLKFLPKDNYAGAAISGFSMRNLRIFANRTNYISHDEVFKGTFVEISSLWDKCRFQEVFLTAAMVVRYVFLSVTLAKPNHITYSKVYSLIIVLSLVQIRKLIHTPLPRYSISQMAG